jgi:hypothetical protein
MRERRPWGLSEREASDPRASCRSGSPQGPMEMQRVRRRSLFGNVPTGSSPGAALVEAGAGRSSEAISAGGPGPGDSRGDPGERPEPLELTSLPYPGMAAELETVGVGGDTSPHY